MRTTSLAFLATMWRFIFWMWNILIIGVIVGILGNTGFTYVTTGSITFKDPRTLAIATWFNAHLLPCVLIFTCALIVTLCSFLAHRQQQQAIQVHQRRERESLITIAGEIQTIGKGIQQALHERSLPNTPPSSPIDAEESVKHQAIWNVPYRRNPFFIGREKLLIHLNECLTTSKTAALTQTHAISGLGGIGKTQIAIEYAYRYKDDYQAILWMRAASRENLVTDFTEIARYLGLLEKDEQDQNKVVEAVQYWLKANPNWLLILDNADEPEIVSDFLPSPVVGHILITTRAHAIGSLADNIEVEKMTQLEGIELVLRRAKILKKGMPLDQVSPQDQSTAYKIAEAMDGLPLALDQAGAYIEEIGCSLVDYLNLYTTFRKELLQRNDKFASHPNVATTFTLAFQKIQQTNPAAADLLRFFAFLDPDAIPEELIIEGAPALGTALESVTQNPLKFQETLGLLRNFSLIRRNADTTTLTIHRLVQAVIKDNMDKRTYHQWVEQTVTVVSQTFPDVEVANWPQCERYISHALMSVILIERHQLAFLKATELLFLVGKYFLERSQLIEAETILKLDLAITEKVQGSNHPDTALSLNNLAELYRAQGDYTQALPLYQRSLAIYEKILGAEHPDTARGLNNLAALYRAQGDYTQALPLLERALAIHEKMLGAEHPDTATSLNNLAGLYYTQGDYTQALPLLKRALAICEQALGKNHPNTKIARANYEQLRKQK